MLLLIDVLLRKALILGERLRQPGLSRASQVELPARLEIAPRREPDQTCRDHQQYSRQLVDLQIFMPAHPADHRLAQIQPHAGDGGRERDDYDRERVAPRLAFACNRLPRTPRHVAYDAASAHFVSEP